MGVKVGPGTVTFTPTSPAGDSYIGTVSEDGNTVTVDGIVYAWNASAGRYQARVPPNSNPPGEWHWYVFEDAETWEKWETHPDPPHTAIHVGTGTYYVNG